MLSLSSSGILLTREFMIGMFWVLLYLRSWSRLLLRFSFCAIDLMKLKVIGVIMPVMGSRLQIFVFLSMWRCSLL